MKTLLTIVLLLTTMGCGTYHARPMQAVFVPPMYQQDVIEAPLIDARVENFGRN